MNYKKRKVIKTNKDGVKTRQVIKDGVVKKTVTRTEGGVEKEIERGNKRIEVQKYKDEGVKNRTVINMVKNSAFRNLPSSMVEDAAKPENNVMMNNKTARVIANNNVFLIAFIIIYSLIIIGYKDMTQLLRISAHFGLNLSLKRFGALLMPVCYLLVAMGDIE